MLAVRAFRGAVAATSVFLVLFVTVTLLQGGRFIGLLPVVTLILAGVVFPTAFLLALPLAAVTRHRGFGAALGVVWVLVLGAAVGGAEVVVLAPILATAGAALGLGVTWPRAPAPGGLPAEKRGI